MGIGASYSGSECHHGCLPCVLGVFSEQQDVFNLVRTTRASLPDLTLSDLDSITRLGSGSFGEVLLVQDQYGRKYALKQMSKARILFKRAQRQLVSECDILLQCDNPFIVGLYQTFKDQQFYYMLLEPALGGDLFQLLFENPNVRLCGDGPASLFYAACISEALGHMHERHIIYRDLKLEHVLLDSTGYVKLCDMGYAKFVSNPTHTLCGTPQYIAPEMIDSPHAHGAGVDWWALGVVVFELLTQRAPWQDQCEDIDEGVVDLRALRRNHELGPDVSLIHAELQNARDFVCRLLCTRPGQRLGAKYDLQEIKAHAWPERDGFDWDALVRRELRAPFVPIDAKITGGTDASSTSAGTDCSEFSRQGSSDTDLDRYGSSDTSLSRLVSSDTSFSRQASG